MPMNECAQYQLMIHQSELRIARHHKIHKRESFRYSHDVIHRRHWPINVDEFEGITGIWSAVKRSILHCDNLYLMCSLFSEFRWRQTNARYSVEIGNNFASGRTHMGLWAVSVFWILSMCVRTDSFAFASIGKMNKQVHIWNAGTAD